MSRYAAGTHVSVDRSKAEIERLVSRYGATQYFAGWHGTAAVIGFRMKDRCVRFVLPLPDPKRMGSAACEKETRRMWRVLGLVLKAKLESVASRVSEFETEFLGNITLPDGKTVGEWAKPQLSEVYASGAMPASLMLYSGKP